MKIVKCDKNHYYDADVNESCPHCKTMEETKGKIYFTDSPTVLLNEDNKESTDSGFAKDERGTELFHKEEAYFAEDDKTIAAPLTKSGAAFVTGWLVCRTGPDQGKDYRLKEGVNRIGRGFQMDVCLSGDVSITLDTHCSVTYDPKSNHFFVSPATGSISYLNGQILAEPVELKNGDMISVGMSELVFIPYCIDGREWTK